MTEYPGNNLLYNGHVSIENLLKYYTLTIVLYIQYGTYYGTCGLFLYNVCRNFQEAADKFSLAIKYNPGVPQYYGNRVKALFKLQQMEEATQDAVCALILDPANNEASSSAFVYPCRMKNNIVNLRTLSVIVQWPNCMRNKMNVALFQGLVFSHFSKAT